LAKVILRCTVSETPEKGAKKEKKKANNNIKSLNRVFLATNCFVLLKQTIKLTHPAVLACDSALPCTGHVTEFTVN
jgi:hypothetical protein